MGRVALTATERTAVVRAMLVTAVRSIFNVCEESVKVKGRKQKKNMYSSQNFFPSEAGVTFLAL
jgi:hypothetical protein